MWKMRWIWELLNRIVLNDKENKLYGQGYRAGNETGLCGDSNASDVINDVMSDLSHGRGGVLHYSVRTRIDAY